MKNKLIVAILAFACAISPAVAVEYWFSGTHPAKNTSLFAANNGCWTNEYGTTAGTLDPNSDVLHLEGAVNLSADSDFDGTFHAGAVDGSGTAPYINLKNYTLDLSKLKWHNATIRINNSRSLGILTGVATLDNPTKTHTLGGIGSNFGGIILGADLACADSEMQITINTHSGDAYYIGLTGDNAGYQGNFKQSTSLTPLFVGHANALGSPSDSRSDALLIDAANAVFSVVKGVTPNATRGIDINKDGFRICATNYTGFADRASDYRDCTEFELPMPITGEYGFTKSGPGTVTLSGNYTAGDIAVESGTLVITSSADFPAGQKISVASGAALYVHQALSGFDITQAEGATVEYVLDTFEVTYDDSTHTATAIARGSSFSIPEGVKQPIALSSAISLPLHDGLQLEVLTVASGAAPLSADDFADETHKTFGLPKTSFEVATDGAGVQHVYLNVRPVVVSVDVFTLSETLNGKAALWSNTAEAQTGFDYLITNQVNNIGNEDFAGDSLTICNNDDRFYVRDVSDKITKATLCAPMRIQQGRGSRNMTLAGDIRIDGDFGDTSYITLKNIYDDVYLALSATLSGEGPLKVTGSKTADYRTGNTIDLRLLGDNSAYKGRIYVTNDGTSPDEYTSTQFSFDSAAALGGALDTFKYDSLTLDNYSVLRPAASIDFSTENRGIYGSGPFGFDVTNGITFKVGVPVKMDDIMFKHGEGDLILGGEISFGGSSSKKCYVREGGIGALDDAAVAGLNVVFSNGTKIVISPEASLVNGFTGVSFETADATVSVCVTDASSALAGVEKFTAVIATVPTSAGDLSSRVALEEIKGFAGTIVTESVTVDEVPCTRYIAKYAHKGLIIFFR